MHIPGTVLFTGEQSRRGYRLNRMAMSLTEAANRSSFVADETGYMRTMELDDGEIDMVQRRDWRGMLEHGGSIYLLIKIAGTLGCSLQEVGRHTSGRTEGGRTAGGRTAGKQTEKRPRTNRSGPSSFAPVSSNRRNLGTSGPPGRWPSLWR